MSTAMARKLGRERYKFGASDIDRAQLNPWKGDTLLGRAFIEGWEQAKESWELLEREDEKERQRQREEAERPPTFEEIVEQVNELKAKVDKLEDENHELKHRIDVLEVD